ncbi:MBL fold metallo-hydrolase [Hydrogenobacter sp. T-2]|uniref:MBL fold metallo-hydrolase n=1 Tax=Pampinifervens diazotrophicum TaxID=1632018 RepID=UPI002B25958D|nr:MBL fold metallo-hydrolase [Hydrogenobacter sp. T-2]WPM32674.1 MBL fold metallo-hydrolase [Hydrogenobacter sp. T-2]
MRYMKLLFVLVFLAYAITPEMKLRRVQKDIYMVRGVDALPSMENRGFMSNAFAVLTEDGWVVIDALSTPELSKEFVDNLMRVRKAPIKYAIITHYHPDHWYGAKTYKELGAKIVAHKKLMDFYQSGEAQLALENAKQRFGDLFKSVVLVPPDIVVEDKYTLKVGGKTFEVIYMGPAHTDNDLVVYMPSEKVLFTGDLVLYNRIPFMGDRGASSKGLVEALHKIKKMDAKVILGGHNEPMDMSAVDFTLGYVQFLRENIRKAKEQGKSIDEIREALKDNPYRKYVMYDAFHNANVFRVDAELDMEE